MGRAIALELGREGANVVVNYNNSEADAFAFRDVAKHMKERNYGKIINIASDAGVHAQKLQGIEYGISKAGLVYFTRSLARTFVCP